MIEYLFGVGCVFGEEFECVDGLVYGYFVVW